ncbi:MAG TPA: hypothetical protein VGR02_15355 [Thermoanaerobaculia bacterium]|jgi:hypothetical protein|nr:hypothetical protein [Thermoanaerobaculia bacterium]
MRQIELPTLPQDATLVSALAAMHASDRSAVVTVGKYGEVRLVRALQLHRAMKSGVATLGEVDGAIVIDTPVVAPKCEPRLGVKWYTTEEQLHGGNFDPNVIDARFGNALPCDYALRSLSIGRAVIVTMEEGLSYALEGGPGACYCTDPRWQHKAKPTDHLCPFGDQSIVECTP